ncbi:Glycerophosphoryl diester phosphodiesterase [Halalkaliarchaeum sp. AArc-CO]|nr:Glycerophosphoryl diester phosphodiesterase [Halalkaliarchaeum sp. AArc-CO]
MDGGPSMLRRRGLLAAASCAGAAMAGCLDGTEDESEVGEEADGPSDAVTAATDHYEFDDRPTVIAHRGYAGTYPENTVDAFEASVDDPNGGGHSRRTDWIELDVVPTSDGEIVVFHDEELGGLTDARGVIYETPAADVLSAEILQSGNTVPTLADAMATIPADVGVNVDIKNGSGSVERGRVADPPGEREEWAWLETVVDVLSEHDNEVLCSSFWEGALFALREIDPEIPIAYIFSESIREGLSVTDDYDAAAVSAPVRMILGTPYFDPTSHAPIDLVEEAHDRGLPIHVWTVETWHQAEQLNAVGVDGLFLDYPGAVHWGNSR